MIVRKIINAAATGGIGYYPVGNPTDAYYDNVSLLLNGDVEVDSNFANVSLLLDGNTLTDKSNNKLTITNTGSVTVSSTVKKFGTGSMAFSGSNSLAITSPSNLSFGTNDFTVEFWFYANSSTSYDTFFSTTLSYSGSSDLRVNTNGSARTIQLATNSSLLFAGNTAFTLNVWNHLAIARYGTNLVLFLNGVNVGSVTNSTNFVSDTFLIGSVSSSYYFNGYIDDLRITKGVARYTSAFTPPVKALPTHEILDSSVYRLPVTAVGNARIDTATKKFGTGAMYFDGSGDYLTLPNSSGLLFGTDNFTIEFWFRQSTAVSAAAIFCNSTNSSVFNANWFYIHANHPTYPNKFCASAYNIASSVPFIAGTTDIVNDNWYHVALVRSSTAFSLYVNGALEGTATSSASIDGNTVYSKYVGGAGDGGLIVNGYIDDLRITKGIARYTANFPPGPTASLPTIPPTISADPWWGNVSLLLDGNTTDAYDPYWQNVSLMLTGDDFIDWSNQHNAVTNNGTVTLDTTNKKFNSSSLSFNGSSQYFNLPSASGFNTDNFTIEFWIRPSSVNTTVSFISNRVAGAADTVFVFGYSNAANVGLFFHTQNTVILNTNTFLTQNSWQHVAAVRISGNLKIYLDGNLVGTAAMSQNLSSTNALYIAKDGTKSDGGQTGLFAGQIADLRITKGIARTITVPPAALPSYKIQDRTQNNLTLTPYGNVQLSTDVMKNGTGSMFFDGTGDYVNVAGTAVLDIKTGDFTLEAWIYPVVSHTNYGRIFHFGPTWAANCYGFSFDNTGKFKFQAANLNGGNAMITSTSVITVNAWSHVAVTRSGSLFNLFVNGVSQGTYTDSAALSSTANQPLYIGMDPNGSATYTGYIDDFRITKGYARYTQNFTPPSQSFATQYISTGYDANYADVSLLLNGNGTNGSQVFTDLSSTPKTITAYGNAQISTAVKKYGTGAMYFDGTGDYINIAGSSATNLTGVDFTVECWLYHNTFGSGTYYKLFNWDSPNDYIFEVTKITSTTFNIGVYCGGLYITSSSSSPANCNQWNHIAFVRNGNTGIFFINGVLINSVAFAPTSTGSNSGTSIGMGSNYPGNYYLNGYIDDLRITKGIARYTTNFTPPTYQLPTDTTGTVIDPLRSSSALLLRGNGTNGSTSFTDESPNGLTVTNNGSVTVNTTTKKYGTGSMAFSGSNYLSVPYSSNINLNATSDWTIESWININTSAVDKVFLEFRGSGTVSDGWVLFINGSNYLQTYDGTAVQTASTISISNQTWQHIALVKSGTSVTWYINGISSGSYTYSGYPNTSSTGLRIGIRQDGTSSITGYIDDLRITKGYARYTANFTPPTYEDPIVTGTVYDYNYPQVSLLLNGDGTNGSTVFKDLSSSPKTITNTGSVAVNTSVKKFGTGSIAFSGSNYLTINSPILDLGAGSFTIELWWNSTLKTNYQSILIGTGTLGAWLHETSTGGMLWGINGSTFSASTIDVCNGVWHHVAFVRNGTSDCTLYIDGVSSVTASNSTDITGTTTATIGTYVGTRFVTGYIDDLRITKGLARYTQNFTPPTAPLPTSYS